MIKIIYGSAEFGGTETCILKIAKELCKQGIENSVYFSSINSGLKQLFDAAGIVINVCGPNVLKKLCNSLNDKDVVLTFNIYEYFQLVFLMNKNRTNCKIYNYVVHPYWLEYSTKNKFLSTITKNSYLQDIRNNVNSGGIFFMDNQTLDYNFELFGYDMEIARKNLLLLPLDNQVVLENEFKKRAINRHHSFKILSIARAEFPFKAYLLGLVNFVARYNLSHEKKLELTIISHGRDYVKLVNLVKSHNDSNIHLINGVNYDSLGYYYKNSSLYIGMGSTILESANYGVICIPIEMYTSECLGNGFFSDYPENIVVDVGMGKMIDDLVNTVIECRDDEYIKMEIESKRAFEKYYSVSKFVDTLFSSRCERNNCNISYKTYIYSIYKYREIKKGYKLRGKEG